MIATRDNIIFSKNQNILPKSTFLPNFLPSQLFCQHFSQLVNLWVNFWLGEISDIAQPVKTYQQKINKNFLLLLPPHFHFHFLCLRQSHFVLRLYHTYGVRYASQLSTHHQKAPQRVLMVWYYRQYIQHNSLIICLAWVRPPYFQQIQSPSNLLTYHWNERLQNPWSIR